VTVNETWNHWYTPETKEQSTQWTSPGEPAPKKAKTLPSAGKVMATVFLGFTRCDLHRLPGEGQNGHRAVLCRIIGPIRRRIAENTAPIVFHHDNAPAHISALAKAKLVELGYEPQPHPPVRPLTLSTTLFFYSN